MIRPIGIEIMLHYYVEGATKDFHKLDTNQTIKEDLSYLIQENMLASNPVNITNNITPYYSITAKGKFYVEYLLGVPLPKERTTYEIERPIEALKKVLS